MIESILFVICLIASGIGAVVGAGGGVIIKPLADALGLLPASTISFLSGTTVLAMSVSSLIRSRNNGVKLDTEISTPVAIGAALGGIAGNILFRMVKEASGNEAALKGIQSSALLVVLLFILIYICIKDRLASKHVHNRSAALAIGLVLGLIGAFLGIGGGPNNVAVLMFFFSMDAKEAAKNSIYVILFSQAASILFSIIMGTVPQFGILELLAMVCGGVGGALIGAAISKRINNSKVEFLMKLLILVVIGIAFINIITSFA